MRRSITSVVSIALALSLIGPAALAAGPGTTVPGNTDDPFTGAPTDSGQGAARRGGFTFFGSGFGHGLGMSQWGSYGLALQGWDIGGSSPTSIEARRSKPTPTP